MTNITKEKIENTIFKFLNNGGDPGALRKKLDSIGSKKFYEEFNKFVKSNNTTNNTENSSSGATVNVYNSNSSILDDPFFLLWLTHSHRSNSSSSECVDDEGEVYFNICMMILTGLAIISLNAFVSYKIYEALRDLKNNGGKILGSFVAFAIQAAISAGLIFFVIKARGMFGEKAASLYQVLAGFNAVISAIACLTCLVFVISALHERYQNGEIAKEYADLAIEKLRSVNENSSNNIPPSGTEEEKPEPSAPPLPSEFIDESHSLNFVNIEGHRGGMMQGNPT